MVRKSLPIFPHLRAKLRGLALLRDPRVQPSHIHGGILGTFLLALLAKEPAMTFPALAIVYEHFYRSVHQGTRRAQNPSGLDDTLWALAQNEFQMCLLMDQRDSVALAGMEKIRAATRGTKQ